MNTSPTLKIIANVFSFCAAAFLLTSTFMRKKEKLIHYQIFDAFFCICADLTIGSYSAATTSFLFFIRNIFASKNKLSKSAAYILIALTVILGLFFNKIGLIGLIPILASTEYTIAMIYAKTANGMRYALILNSMMWIVHDAYMGLFPTVISSIIIIIFSIINILREKKEKNKKMC